jgi:5-methylthioribose kinase
MADIAKVVSELHFNFKDWSPETVITNTSLRRLNHHHIFEFPLQLDNGFDLDDVQLGLKDATKKIRSDNKLKSFANDLGDVYLAANGERLLHGDYYPGSWLKTDQGFRMIDPEFCYTGKPEFELGVVIAHLKMAQQPDSLIKDMFVYYHFDRQFDGSLFTKFAGIEVIRRILGLAQLPLDLTLKERLDLLDQAYEWVING